MILCVRKNVFVIVTTYYISFNSSYHLTVLFLFQYNAKDKPGNVCEYEYSIDEEILVAMQIMLTSSKEQTIHVLKLSIIWWKIKLGGIKFSDKIIFAWNHPGPYVLNKSTHK